MSWRSGLGVVLALAVLGQALPCHAQQAATTPDKHKVAQDAHRQALQLFDKGEHARALVEFRRAYALAPSFRILYNIGLSSVALGDSRSAVEAFAGYLRDGGERIPESRRQQVEAELTRLSKLLAGLVVQVEEPGAELSVDGEMLGKAPLSRQMRVNAGKHEVVVRSADGTLKTQNITLEPGEERQLHFGAVAGSPVQATGSRREEKPASPPPSAQPRQVPWVAWGVTGTLGLATAITGAVALGARSDERAEQERQGVKPADLSAARDKVENLALATDVLLAGTALAAGVSLYLTLRPSPTTTAQTALIISLGQLSLRRTF